MDGHGYGHECAYPYHCDRCLMRDIGFWHTSTDDPGQDRDEPGD